MNFRFLLLPVMDASEFGITNTAGLPVGGSAVVFYLSPRPPLQKERGRRGSWDLWIFALDSSLLHQQANPMNFRFILRRLAYSNGLG